MRSLNSNLNKDSRSKKQNGSIHRQQGWGLFLLGLSVSVIFGLSVRSYFSPQSIEYWLQQELKKSNLAKKVVIQNPRLSLHQNSMPGIGLTFEFISFPVGLACGPRRATSELKLQSVYLPLRLSSLLRGEIQLAEAVVKRLEWTAYTDCSNPKDDLDVEPPQLLHAGGSAFQVKAKRPDQKNNAHYMSATDFLAKAQDYFLNRWQSDWQNTKDIISGLRIEQLDLFVGDQQQRWGQFLNFEVDVLDNGQVSIDSKVYLESFVFGGHEVRPFKVRLLTDSLRTGFKLNGLFREGVIDFEGSVDWKAAKQKWEMFIKDVPLETVAATVTQWSSQKFLPINFNQTWASCRVQQNSSLDNYLKAPVGVSDCLIYGKGGKVNISDLALTIKDLKPVAPFVISFIDLSIEHLGSLLGKKNLHGVFNNLGRLYGSLTFKSFDEVSGNLDLKNLELAFSNRGLHGRQKIHQVRMELNYANQRFSGLISHIDFEKGFFAGTLSFNFDSLWKAGILQLKINRMQLSPSIQKLMVGGEVSPLEIYGQAQIAQGELYKWRGVLGVPKLKGENWNVDGVKFKTDWEDGRFSGTLSIADFELAPKERFSTVIHPIFLVLNDDPKATAWKSLTGQFKIDKEGGKWENLSVKLNRAGDTGQSVLKSEGSWLRNGKITAAVSVKRRKWPIMKWDLLGNWSKMQLYPSLEMVKQLVFQNKSNPSKLDEKILIRLQKHHDDFVKKRAALSVNPDET